MTEGGEKFEPNINQLKILYIIGMVSAVAHLAVGIIWQTTNLPPQNAATLKFPYFGGYLVLVAIALLLVFVYLMIALRKQPEIPLHMRRYYLILSIILIVASLVLIVMMSIRTNDYMKEKDNLNNIFFYRAFISTVIDIIVTIALFPVNLLITKNNYMGVKMITDKLKKQEYANQNAPQSDRRMQEKLQRSKAQPQNQQDQQQNGGLKEKQEIDENDLQLVQTPL